MKSLQVANALLRSGASTCNALSRSAPLLSSTTSRIASPASTSSIQLLQYTHATNVFPASRSSSRSFSQTSAQYRKRGKNRTYNPKYDPDLAESEQQQEPVTRQQGGGKKNNNKKDQQQKTQAEIRASKRTPSKKEREAQAAAAAGGGGEQTNEPQAKPSSSTPGPSTIDPDRPFPDPEQPFDFADLIYTFDKAESHHTSELTKLRTAFSAGRSTLTTEQIGAIPVCPDKKTNPHATFPLRELATIAPIGGRRFSILAFEQASIKPIMSAVQTSAEFNQQPQKNEENPLELTITVEPERADALQKRVKDICLAWRGKIRDVVHKREQMHKKWKTAGMIVSDDVHRLKEKVQKMQDERMKVVAAKEKELLAAIAKR